MKLPDKATAEELDRHLPKRPCHLCARNDYWQELRWPDSLICKFCHPDQKVREERGEARSVTFDPARRVEEPVPGAKSKPPAWQAAAIDELWRE